jgi:hypothetical protein
LSAGGNRGRRERRGKELTRGATESEGERKGGESRRALGLGEKKRRWAGLAHAGRKGRRGEGPTGEKEGVWAAGCCSLLLFFFFSFSFVHSNIQIKLFEFN